MDKKKTELIISNQDFIQIKLINQAILLRDYNKNKYCLKLYFPQKVFNVRMNNLILSNLIVFVII